MIATEFPGEATAGALPALYRRRWWILGLLFIATILNYLDRQILAILPRPSIVIVPLPANPKQSLRSITSTGWAARASGTGSSSALPWKEWRKTIWLPIDTCLACTESNPGSNWFLPDLLRRKTRTGCGFDRRRV